ncbi:MAG: CehA/McbA family metallohydrolase [Chloroflexota bacterium]
MPLLASPHFSTIDLTNHYNTRQSELSSTLALSEEQRYLTYGSQVFRGIPFTLGPSDQPNVLVLEETPVAISADHISATYIVFLHAVEDKVTNYQDGFADTDVDGNELGNSVSEYTLEYADGTSASTPILRRFAIQQSRIGWGASAFAAVPAQKPDTHPSLTELQQMGNELDWFGYGQGEVRHLSGREGMREKLWLYALPNPHPDKPIQRIVCTPQRERSVIYGISTTQLTDHPLRPGTRKKARLTLPEGISLNPVDELECNEGTDIDIDMGVIISARAALDYDVDRWLGSDPLAPPEQSTQAVVVEYAAHPQARLAVGSNTDAPVAYDLASLETEPAEQIISIEPAERLVKIKVVEKGTNHPAAVRIHMHGAAGEYLPPRGYHRKVNGYWFEDNYGEFRCDEQQYAYIWGECEADLPLGDVYVEITKGYEVTPLRTKVSVTPETDALVFELERVLSWRSRGWVTADTHVHFLTPQTALLEGAAEGVNVVNLLASQWGEMFSNVSDFDGKTTFSAGDLAGPNEIGEGEFLVRVGTENRMQVLGHISLLGYSGNMIHPLCTGGPSESAIGDPQEVTMAEWAQRCIDQGGLTVMPHGPNPQCERAADLVLGLINAVEMMTFNPQSKNMGQISPYGIADWYRYLNLGYQVPICGGSDKMAASSLLGGIRTYAQMGELAFSYENWMEAMRRGNTFVTVGPLVELTVEGVAPGGEVKLPESGGTVNLNWNVESVSLPVESVEIIVGSLTHEEVSVNGLSAEGSAAIPISQSTWIAIRVRGSYQNRPGEIAAHTSAVHILVGDQPIFSKADAITVLEQIEGAIAYVDTLAPRPDVIRFKQLRATLESAHNRLHQQMHRNGFFHTHTPLHNHENGHEH